MYRLLILFLACLFFLTGQIEAQVPQNITLPQPVKPAFAPSNPDFPCNNAGTFTLGAFTGQSNDTDLDTIYLCFNDQIAIDHNGDAVLTGDPNPATPPGVGWAFFECPPSIAGDNLQTILSDPCILPGAVNGIWVATGNPQGDITFTNNGNLQTAFNAGQPLLLHFAPITLDVFANQGFESAQTGFPPGPCVNLNTNAEFAVVYLNAITESGISTNFGNDCIGKFRVRGGFPEFNNASRYTISITLASNPNVKAVVHTAQSQLFHSADVIFSAPQAGVYNVTIEDGKSCGRTFQITMGSCDASDNVTFSFPDVNVPENTQVCVPITLRNFQNIIGASFSITWDPTLLDYTTVQNPNSAILPFSPGANLNENQSNNGQLGFLFFDTNNQGVSIADGDTLFEICFNTLGQLGDCSPLDLLNSPTFVNVENFIGEPQGVTVDLGSVCVADFPVQLQVAVVDTTCFGPSATAAIQITPTDGTPPYQVIYRLLPSGAANNDLINAPGESLVTAQLGSGAYLIEVTDNNGFGNVVRDTVILDFPSLGAALSPLVQPSCFGLSDGSITAGVSLGGANLPFPAGPDYTFSWSNNVPIPGAQVQNNLPGGVLYSVTITQVSTGCFATASGTLGQPSPVRNAAVQIVPASCSGVNDGAITYSGTGGTPFSGNEYDFNWTYSEDGQPPFSNAGFGQTNPFQLSNLASGFYQVTITDANGCNFVDEVEVPNVRTVSVDAQLVQNVSCFGGSNGAITVNANANPPYPNPNYVFFWFPGAVGNQNDTPTSSTLSGLAPGTYTVLAIDSDGCSDSDSFTVTQPPVLVLDTLNFQNPNCLGPNTGAIRVTTTGGAGSPYNYVWSDGPLGAARNNLGPGTYCVTVFDPNGCTDTLCFTLQLPTPPVITGFDSVAVACGGDGCLRVIAPTATTFQWTTLSGTPVGNTALVCGLNGGAYIVTVRDANNCESRDTVTLGFRQPMVFSDTTLTRPACFGDANGTIAVGVSGGNPPYVNYQWSVTASPIPLLTNIGAGTYGLTVTDSRGCTLVGSFVLQNPPPIVSFFTNIQPASCAGICNGTATVVASLGANPPIFPNFNFAWQDGSTDSVRANLCPGFNRVTITDANNCFRIDSVFIGSPSVVLADTIFSTPVSCHGGADGSATVQGIGGNGAPFTYRWSNNALTATAANLSAGNYSVTITDRLGCTGTASVTVVEPAPISVLKDDNRSEDIFCFGDDNGALAVTVAGGTPPYAYQWSDGTSIIGNTELVDGLRSGVYRVTVTDATGCTSQSDFIPLNDPPAVQGEINPWEELPCNGDLTTLVIDTIFGGGGAPYQFTVDFGVKLDQDFPIEIGGGEHYITYYDRFNCEFTDTIFVFEPDPIQITFDSTIIIMELGDSLQLRPNITGAVIDSFVWSPANLLLYPDSIFPRAYAFESTTYTLRVWDVNGCTGTGSVFVKIDPNRNVYIPNIFIPGNSRGLNDHFNVFVGTGVEIVNYMQVYDRWGSLLYERNDFYPDNDVLNEGWNGKYKGEFVNPGVYVYIVEVKFLDGRVLLYRGDVTVAR
jgi:hypothetical protein